MSALNVTIDPSIKGAWPEARLGCFIYTADVRAREDSLWTCLENEVAPYLKTMLETTPLARSPTSPNPGRRTRPSARTDAARFVRSLPPVAPGQGPLPDQQRRDANNLSLETGFSLGSYDTARISADIVFRLGKAGEVYPGIGKDDIALENMPLLADWEGAFGSPTSDSTRAMITQETRSCLTVVFSFSARSKLEEALALTVKRFGQYANPSHAESFIIE
ncbi:MAG: hypothetical protein ACLT2T_06900 [Bilophila wadsworthia]